MLVARHDEDDKYIYIVLDRNIYCSVEILQDRYEKTEIDKRILR